MDINTLMAIFCEEMQEYTDTPFYCYPQESYHETEVKSWAELMIRAAATRIDMILSYWGADESEDPEDPLGTDGNIGIDIAR